MNKVTCSLYLEGSNVLCTVPFTYKRKEVLCKVDNLNEVRDEPLTYMYKREPNRTKKADKCMVV